MNEALEAQMRPSLLALWESLDLLRSHSIHAAIGFHVTSRRLEDYGVDQRAAKTEAESLATSLQAYSSYRPVVVAAENDGITVSCHTSGDLSRVGDPPVCDQPTPEADELCRRFGLSMAEAS